MLNVLIVDDEPLAIDVMETLIAKVPDLNLVGKCTNALDAGQMLRKEKIDLLFLDIEMPQMTGIELVKTLANPPMIIFTTAYPNFAVEGFELNAIDYLLKPISLERFMKGVNKALAQHRLNNPEVQVAPAVSPGPDDFFFVKTDKKLVKVFYQDIIYIEGLKDYVILRLDNSRIITLQTMKSLEAKLPEGTFKRIHRSYIVNVSRIQALLGNMVEVIEKGQAKHIPVGKSYRDDIQAMIEDKKL